MHRLGCVWLCPCAGVGWERGFQLLLDYPWQVSDCGSWHSQLSASLPWSLVDSSVSSRGFVVLLPFPRALPASVCGVMSLPGPHRLWELSQLSEAPQPSQATEGPGVIPESNCTYSIWVPLCIPCFSPCVNTYVRVYA